MIEELRGSGGVLWLPDHEAEALRLHLEYVEGHILTAADTVYPAGSQLIPLEESPVPLDPDSWGKTRFYSEGDPRISYIEACRGEHLQSKTAIRTLRCAVTDSR